LLKKLQAICPPVYFLTDKLDRKEESAEEASLSVLEVSAMFALF